MRRDDNDESVEAVVVPLPRRGEIRYVLLELVAFALVCAETLFFGDLGANGGKRHY